MCFKSCLPFQCIAGCRPANLRWDNWVRFENGAIFEILLFNGNSIIYVIKLVEIGAIFSLSHFEAWFWMGLLLDSHSEWVTVGRSGWLIQNKIKSYIREGFCLYTHLHPYIDGWISGQNANPIQKMLSPTTKPQPQNTKISGISYIVVLSVAL